ncbi:MAG: toxin-antitoxin system protein [Acidobacteriota bacterium]|nr:toxin-antitoxin system protein [Acidobacteriota bacterium]
MNVSISEKSQKIIRQISETENMAISDILDDAVEVYRRQKLLSRTNQAFQKLKEDPQAWREELADRQLWERTLTDGAEIDD